MRNIRLKVLACGLIFSVGVQADVLHIEDVIIISSACVGFDCADGESFGFDTGRYKESNLRIHFDDTSTGGFPSNDWRIIINDATNGGASYFAVEDSTAGRIPFRVEAGAPTNALYVDDGGRIGIGTSNPIVETHIVDGDSPTLRLEQDNSSGFTPQTWDLVSNEANFFIRDVTNGSTLPFRIRPGAPTSAIDISAAGNVGFGTDSPSFQLDVQGNDASSGINNATALFITNSSGTTAGRVMLGLENNGTARFSIENSAVADARWVFAVGASASFRISKADTPVVEFEVTPSGDVNAQGTFNTLSDRNSKTQVKGLDSNEILNKVVSLPLSSWSYKDDLAVRHIGPMAQDFHTTFGLGGSNKSIATVDASGVALVAIQALAKRNQLFEKENQIQKQGINDLKAENAQLKTAYRELLTVISSQQDKLDKIDQLEQLVNQLITSQDGQIILTTLK